MSKKPDSNKESQAKVELKDEELKQVAGGKKISVAEAAATAVVGPDIPTTK